MWRSPLPWAVAALTLASLAWLNRDGDLDAWAPYFFTAYGLGVLAAWAGRSRLLGGLFGAVCAIHPAGAWWESRPRVATACLTAIALATLASRWHARGRAARALAYWSDASYGVFLIHYAVIVAATALWLRLEPGSPAAAWGLLALCWAASLAAGAALHRCVGAPLSRLPWAGLRRVSVR